MYATAHRVLSPKNQVGVNTFLHLHGPEELHFDERSIDNIGASQAGALVAERLEILPGGGNRVLSYLDVVCRDETDPALIRSALQNVVDAIRLNQRPIVQRFLPGILVRFACAGGLGQAETIEFATLRNCVQEILERRPPPVWMGKEPLTVIVQREGDLVGFQLDEQGQGRVGLTHIVRLPAIVLNIDIDTLSIFERLHGELIRQVLPALTGLSMERIREGGGAKIVRKGDGRVLWEWPLRGQVQPPTGT